MSSSEVPLIVPVGHRAFAKVGDDLDIFVVMEAKSRVGSDLTVIENDEIPDRLVSRIAIRSHPTGKRLDDHLLIWALPGKSAGATFMIVPGLIFA